MDSLTRMRAFVQVVESGGFTAAARETGRSKALISKYVRELEDGLGVRLLNRTTRQLSLTEAGRTYYREVGGILQQIDDLQSTILDTHTEPRGRLKVAAPRSFGDGDLGRAFMEFMVAYPKITLNLRLEDRLVDVVEEGFDVAIRISRLADSSLIARKLVPFRVVTCAHPDVIARYGRPAGPAALSDAPCIIDTNMQSKASWPYMVDGKVVNVAVSGRVEVNSPVAVRLAAIAGLGFARTPFIAVRDDIESGALVPILEANEIADLAMFAVYPHRRHLSGKVRAFIDFLVGWFGTHPPGSHREA